MKKACRKAVTETLLELAREDKRIIAVTSDARGSVTLEEYAKELPEQFIDAVSYTHLDVYKRQASERMEGSVYVSI